MPRVYGRPIRFAKTRAVGGGVVVRPAGSGGLWAVDRFGPNAVTPTNPMLADDEWVRGQLDANPLSKMAAPQLLQRLVDISPDISRAYYDLMLFMNPGWDYDVFPAGSRDRDKPEPLLGDERDAVDLFFDTLAARHKTVDLVFDRLFGAAAIRGAYLAELVLDKATATIPLDIATPDPAVVRFRREPDPTFGSRWAMGQHDERGRWVPLDDPTVCYVPIHPLPDQPWGRPLFGPAMFSCLFLLAMLHDIRRVIQTQGWPRPVIKLLLDKIVAAMPDEEAADPAKVQAFVDGIRDDVALAWDQMQPDSAYVTPDYVEVGQPVGTTDPKSLGAVDGVIRVLERQIVRALKTMPLLMGSNEGSTETHANRQMDLHLAGIQAMQHRAESLMGYILETMLRTQGLQGRVKFRFAQLRGSEVERDERVAKMRADRAAFLYDRGLITHDQEAQIGSDLPAAAFPEPLVVGKDPYPGQAEIERREKAAAALAEATKADGDASEQAADNGTNPDDAEQTSGKANGNGRHADLGGTRLLAGGRETEKFAPKDKDLPPRKKRTSITDAERKAAVADWDAAFPDYAGMLEAALTGDA